MMVTSQWTTCLAFSNLLVRSRGGAAHFGSEKIVRFNNNLDLKLSRLIFWVHGLVTERHRMKTRRQEAAYLPHSNMWGKWWWSYQSVLALDRSFKCLYVDLLSMPYLHHKFHSGVTAHPNSSAFQLSVQKHLNCLTIQPSRLLHSFPSLMAKHVSFLGLHSSYQFLICLVAPNSNMKTTEHPREC